MRRLVPLVLRARSLPVVVLALVAPSVAAFTVVGPQLGLAVGAISVGALLVIAARARYDEAIEVAPSPDDRYRLLVVAARALEEPELAERIVGVIGSGAAGHSSAGAWRAELRVLAPTRQLAPRPLGRRRRSRSRRGAALAGALARHPRCRRARGTGRCRRLRRRAGDRGRASSFPAREVVLVEGPGLGAGGDRGGAPPPRPAGHRVDSVERRRAALRSRRPSAPSAVARGRRERPLAGASSNVRIARRLRSRAASPRTSAR